MKRDLQFKPGHGKLYEVLGISEARINELDKFVSDLVNRDASVREIIVALNERGDLTDAEWTNAIYTLGWFACVLNNGRSS